MEEKILRHNIFLFIKILQTSLVFFYLIFIYKKFINKIFITIIFIK